MRGVSTAALAATVTAAMIIAALITGDGGGPLGTPGPPTGLAHLLAAAASAGLIVGAHALWRGSRRAAVIIAPTLVGLGEADVGAFEGWSGYYRQTRTGVLKGASAARLRANSPIDAAIARRPRWRSCPWPRTSTAAPTILRPPTCARSAARCAPPAQPSPSTCSAVATTGACGGRNPDDGALGLAAAEGRAMTGPVLVGVALSGPPLPVIALMTAATNIVAVAGGLVVFAEPLGVSAVASAVHVLAFGLVGAAAWRLSAAQARVVGARA